MNNRSRFIRKVSYAVALILLLMPIWWLSRPGVTNAQGQLIQGGKLAQIRQENQLSQASLGEIDPASETIKLATLGLRGVAANILWGKANEFKKTEDWTSFSAALEQIIRLQPNFISVWQFQAWNLSYNVSVEFDDYHDRYRWVMRGIKFLQDGTKYNTNEPQLLWDLGWTISQKIGRADEHVQYRRLFRQDDEFHGSRPLSQRDNWLVGREWFLEAEHVVDDLGVPIKGRSPHKNGKSPLIFYSDSAMCQMNYADAMEDEGTFGEVAKNAWQKAGDLWTKFGDRNLATTYNLIIHLNDKEKNDERAKQALADLEALLPEGTKDKIREEKIAKLNTREQAALNTAEDKRNADQQGMMYTINDKINVTASDLANRVDEANRAKALDLAEQVAAAHNLADIIDRYRDIVNFKYWRGRAAMEQDDDTLAARKLIYQANKDFEGARISESVKLYEEGFQKWRAVLDKHPDMLNEMTVYEDLSDDIRKYQRNLQQLERKLPDDFPLKDVMERSKERMGEPEPVPQEKAAEEAVNKAESGETTK